MHSRRRLLQLLPSVALTACGRVTASSAPSAPLRTLSEQSGLLIGAATANYQIKDADFATALMEEASILVPEYELKRFLTEPKQGELNFTDADALCDFAKAHGQRFRGHPIIWHAANPPWLEEATTTSRDSRLVTDYVQATAAHFRGRVHSWDVVNEALRPEHGLKGGYRNSFWMKTFGPSYIDLAFHAARAADPDALLIYNDYGCEDGAPDNDVFRAATLDLLEGLIARKVPIDGYGMQGHLSAYGPGVNQRKLADFLSAVQSMGLKTIITEHDVNDSGGPNDIATRDIAVADAAQRFLDVVLDNRSVIALLTWGLTDRYLHADGVRATLFSQGLRKLPLDPALARTPLWHAIAGAVSKSRYTQKG